MSRPRTRSFDRAAAAAAAGEAEEGERVETEEERKERKRLKKEAKKAVEEVEAAGAPLGFKAKEERKRPRSRASDEEVDETEAEESEPAGKHEKKKVKQEEASTIKTYPLKEFELSATSLAALAARGISSLFEIQKQTFPHIIGGKDVIGRAHTGCGKTLAFALPVVELLLKRGSGAGGVSKTRGRGPAVLIMAPTRELALQVSKEFDSTAPSLETLTVYGGASIGDQARKLWSGVDCVVGTPGRICDHLERGNLKLGSVCHLILDEADQMLDMGFKDEMQKVFDAIAQMRESSSAQLPALQTLLFSATLPQWVQQVARDKMQQPVTVDLVGNVDKQASSDVEHLSLMCPWQERGKTVSDLIRMYGNVANSGRTIVFCQTKKDCNELMVDKEMAQDAKVLHGDIPQNQREATLSGFRTCKFHVLIATDVAARGLDIQGVDLVVQVQPPAGAFTGKAEVETYVHRAGRTGRAGRKGVCVTLYKHSQGDLIRAIERGTGNTLRRIGAPQPEDLLVAAAGDAGDKFADLSKQIVAKFLPSADKIIKAMGAREALAAALAQITGFTDTAMLMPSSVLQCAKGYVTLQYDSATPLNGLGLVWAALRRELPPQAVENVRGMTLTEDMLGAVFDYDLRFKDDLDKALEEQQDAKLRIITELPPLQEKPSFSPGNFGGARGGFSGGRGGFGARGGARGGFGTARGRGGARGGRGRGGW